MPDIAQEIIEQRSPAFQNSKIMALLTKAIADGSVEDLDEWTISLIGELDPRTATWSIPLHEFKYGITPMPGATDAQRRDALVAKMSASASCTGAFLRQFIAQQSGGRVVAITKTADCTYTIGITGRTKDLAALNAAIDEVIPAHLAITVIDQAFLWAAFDGYGYTESQWDALGLSWYNEEVYAGTPHP